MTRSGRVATLEEAKAQFKKSWDAWRRGRSWRKLRGLSNAASLRSQAWVAVVVILLINLWGHCSSGTGRRDASTKG